MDGAGGCRASALLGVALVLLKAPGRWTREHLARDATGAAVQASDDAAVRWSSLGALIKASAVYRLPKADASLAAAVACLRRACDTSDLSAWEAEPSRVRADVLAALRRAILIAHTEERTRSAA